METRHEEAYLSLSYQVDTHYQPIISSWFHKSGLATIDGSGRVTGVGYRLLLQANWLRWTCTDAVKMRYPTGNQRIPKRQ